MTVTVDLLYRKDGLVAVNKPVGVDCNGLPSGGYPNLLNIVAKYIPAVRPVARIDRDTSGIVLYAETIAVRQYLSKLYMGGNDSSRRRKMYAAVCRPAPETDEFIVDVPLRTGAKTVKFGPAKTGFRVMERRDDGSAVLECELLEHGRTHQIRKHLLSVGCPIVGDPWYKGVPGDRMYLHAWKAWIDKDGGTQFEAPCTAMGIEAPVLETWTVPPLTKSDVLEIMAELPPIQSGPGHKMRPDGMAWSEWQKIRPRRTEVSASRTRALKKQLENAPESLHPCQVDPQAECCGGPCK